MILLRLCGWGLMTGAFGKLRKLTRSQNSSLLNVFESFAVKIVLFGAASHLPPPLCLIFETQHMDKNGVLVSKENSSNGQIVCQTLQLGTY